MDYPVWYHLETYLWFNTSRQKEIHFSRQSIKLWYQIQLARPKSTLSELSQNLKKRRKLILLGCAGFDSRFLWCSIETFLIHALKSNNRNTPSWWYPRTNLNPYSTSEFSTFLSCFIIYSSSRFLYKGATTSLHSANCPN